MDEEKLTVHGSVDYKYYKIDTYNRDNTQIIFNDAESKLPQWLFVKKSQFMDCLWIFVFS